MGEDFLTLDDFDLKGKNVLVRVDINSPIDPSSGRILNDARIRSHVDTLRDLERSKAVILGHQSRPGKADFTTLKAHSQRLSRLLGKKVKYVDSLFGATALRAIKRLETGNVLLLENTRMFSEEIALKNQPLEKQSNSHIVQTIAPLMDLFVHDAFAAAHRSQPSLVGFSEVLPTVAGRVMERELTALGRFLDGAQRPNVALLGGIKADDSIRIARHLLDEKLTDKVLTTGMVGNLFLMASGTDVGDGTTRLAEREVDDLDAVIREAGDVLKKHGDQVGIPGDVAVNSDGNREGMRVAALPSKHQIADIGLDTIVSYSEIIGGAKSAIMNGPAGVFEIPDFAIGTSELMRALAYSDAYSIIGGGHTIAAAEKFDLTANMDHVSTGGGSLMAFLSGKTMPGVEALRKWKKKSKS